MEEEIKYQLVEKEIFPQYKKKLINYYNRYFPKESNRITIPNSTVYFIAIRGEKLIGVCRLLTDFSRYALLLDLIVRKAERNKGIGKTLVRLVNTYAKEKQIKHLILTTDSRYNWLTDFYRKLGFRVITEQSLMEYTG